MQESAEAVIKDINLPRATLAEATAKRLAELVVHLELTEANFKTYKTDTKTEIDILKEKISKLANAINDGNVQGELEL